MIIKGQKNVDILLYRVNVICNFKLGDDVTSDDIIKLKNYLKK